MALVTIPSLEGEPIEDVANTIFRAWGVGHEGQRTKASCCCWRSATGAAAWKSATACEPILPDGLDGHVLREMRPALRQQHYGDAMMAAAETIGGRIAQAKHVTLTAQRSAPRTLARSGDSHPLAADGRAAC